MNSYLALFLAMPRHFISRQLYSSPDNGTGSDAGSNGKPEQPSLTLADVEAMLQPLTTQLLKDIQTFVSDTVDPFTKRLEQIESTLDAGNQDASDPRNDSESDQDHGELSRAIARIAELEKLQEQAKEKEREGSFLSSLGEAVDGFSPLHRAQTLKILQQELRGQVELVGDRWVSKEGKTLADLTGEFFSSDFGKHLLPSTHKDGTGTPSPEKPPATSKDNGLFDIVSAFR